VILVINTVKMFSHSQHFVKLIPYLIIIQIYLATCFGTKCHHQATVKTNDFLYNAMLMFSVVGSHYVLWFRLLCFPAQHKSTTYNILYITYSICISSNSDESKKLPGDGRPLPKHVGACILNKGVVQFSE
jgi:vacuolar-type H+-ATPase subunit I/STV1